ncbi:DUF2330 domain-containing protein [Streptomyces melanogenes]|uniref:DUF2330 domain-containing protein n=1 Tax=Streptomyces melanogenes TaxID=67326 RepID=A0ABZ1XHQ2_9ACTN|nr:DUF2330 domain-containing protein [Streptomyces melanogenes]
MRGRGGGRGSGVGIGRRIGLLMGALLALQVVSIVSPAYACGCGAMVHGTGTELAVRQETSAVRWDGRGEQIVMSLTVDGNAPKAAWIMPVPHRATVTLGDRALFSDLERATAPVHKDRDYFWPRAGDWPFTHDHHPVGEGAAAPSAAAPPVGVVDRRRLGPFDVARLTATDPEALRSWLETNGFQLPPALSTELRPYVAQKWEYVAIRLAPASGDGPLSGTLDPLKLTFASERPVYPMRLSRLAKTPQSLKLYVVSTHRMEPESPIGGAPPEVLYAGKVPLESTELARFAGVSYTSEGNTPYLTALSQSFRQPSAITGDHELKRASNDTAFERVIWTDRLMRVAGIPAWLLTVTTGLAAVATTALLLVRRGLRRRRVVVPPPPVVVPPPLG